MDILATCLSGAVAKIYDDLTENNIITDGFFKESLHTLSCFLLVCSAMNDFTYGVLLYSVNVFANFGDKDAFSEDKEKSILYLFPVVLILSLPYIRQFTIIELITIIVSSPLAFIESSSVKEDVSLRKFIMRMIFIGIIIGLIALNTWFEFFSSSMIKLVFFCLFYLAMSCVFQAYELFFKHFHIGIKIDETFFKDIMRYKASGKALSHPGWQQHNESSETNHSSYEPPSYCTGWYTW